MKKPIVFVLVVLVSLPMCIALAGCGGKTEDTSDKDSAITPSPNSLRKPVGSAGGGGMSKGGAGAATPQ